MLRMRRYRIFVILATVLIILLYRTVRNSDSWDSLPVPYGPKVSRPEPRPNSFDDNAKKSIPHNDETPRRPVDVSKGNEEVVVKMPELKPDEDVDSDRYKLPTTKSPLPKATGAGDSESVVEKTKAAPKPVVTIPIPDRVTPEHDWNKNKNEGLHIQYPDGGHEGAPAATTTRIHWSKQPEHFPIAPDAIIALPTDKPKSIPRVQYEFKEESAEAREKREARLAKVKAEAKRAWSGYRKHAWMHDEVSPVSKKFRDPFCGWAATLVDALDTLWIMGMTDEFDEAVEAVGTIDFTTSAQRAEIPVFETTIRYLGGLLGAWDVSGHNEKYKILVDKAVELAEILVVVFDTPNRMPVLYYNWKPEYASQPKRAGPGVSVAELGSLSMEFTRLAQVTKKTKYYDAVARITDAFEDWQNRGTSIPGIFPERVDATGCNKTAATKAAQLKIDREVAEQSRSVVKPPEGYTGREYSSKPQTSTGQQPDTEFVVQPAVREGEPAKSEFHHLSRRSSVTDEPEDHPLTAKDSTKNTKPKDRSPPDIYLEMITQQVTGQPYEIDKLGGGTCYPQGLTSSGWGSDSYSMGGSQDSTYEYFPKQYLLLGGLEPKYRTMHLKVADAVRKWLLYRPMVPDDRDILFSAKVSTRGNPSEDAMTEFEVTHLTCFLGGMFGLGGKIFEDKIDVEIGKKLTDGCVWAYESMPTGIMPEGAVVVPCAEVNNCHWNQTLYWQYLDPLWDSRDQQMKDYEAKMEELMKERARIAQEKQEELRRAAELKADVEEKEEKLGKDTILNSNEGERGFELRGPPQGRSRISNTKRILATTADEKVETSSINVEGEVGTAGSPVQGQVPLQAPVEEPVIPDPVKPMTHEEYVQNRLKNQVIPPGFVNVNWAHYILRPEAIESVWYMYRITGDTTWQDKGWRMFESIIAATQTEAGHSAINNVLSPKPDKSNEMESFWLAETLKYFYLLYSTPDVISLDEWVLNTEAHPFKRPLPN